MNLDDAKAILERAQHLYEELKAVIYATPGRLWEVTDGQDPDTGEWFYRLNLDRPRLTRSKPLVAECASAVSSSLDHIAAAIVKAGGKENGANVYFPWGSTDDLFKERLGKARGALGDEMAEVIADARAKHRHNAHHVHAAKKISRTGKHWELLATVGSAHSISHSVLGKGEKVFQIPNGVFKEADQFEFHRDADRLPPEGGWQILVGLTVDGLDDGLPKSLDSIFPCSFRFVWGTIEAVEEVSKHEVQPKG